MDNSKVPGFGRSDKQMADAFGMSVSDFKKVKKQIVSDMTKPKVTAKVTAKPTAKATVKPTAKATPKPTKTPLSKSEKDFLAGQKYKAKITKKTGIYPNTAN
jgi:hypothetical protein